MKKSIMLVLVLCLLGIVLTGCFANKTSEDIKRTFSIGDELAKRQPTPNDFDYSIPRWLLIRRAYVMNGQLEKARTYPRPVDNIPLAYVRFISGGVIMGSYVVDGIIMSKEAYLTPDGALAYDRPIDRRAGHENDTTTNLSGETYMAEMPDVDGTYGNNGGGFFFFSPDGEYHEWIGEYQYDTKPFTIEQPSLHITLDN